MRLQEQYSSTKVSENRLFVRSGRIFTSAGIATGIDLALYLVEEQHGADFACVVAKDMVVYMRRDLAGIIFVSPRNLTRAFKTATGLTIGQYIQILRQEKAKQLLKGNHKTARVAKECGYKNAGSLHKLNNAPLSSAYL